MRIASIVTMDEQLTFNNIEIENVNNINELDQAIADGKVLTVIENSTKYKLNSTYIIYYIE